MRDKDRANDRHPDSRLVPEEERKLYAEQVKLLGSNVPASSIATLVCSSALIFVLWKVISPAVLIPWLGCLFLVTFLRYLLALRYTRASKESRESARWGGRLIASIAAVGLAWGSAGIFLFAEGSLVHQFFLIFVLGGMIAGAVGSYSVIRWAFPAFALPASLPIIIHSIIQGGKIEITMGALELLFVIIMLVVSRRMHAAIVKSLRLQFENIGLISDLTAAKETAEKTSEELRTEIAERERTEERLRHQEKFERLINTISNEFINIKADEIDGRINWALKRIGEEVGADRSYLFLFDMDKMMMENTHEWCAGGIEPQIDNLKKVPFEALPWWMEKLNRLEDIHIPRVSDLPPEADAEKEILQPQKIQSIIVVPLIFGNSLIGFMGFDSVRTERSWPEETIGRLRIVGEIFINALKHREADDQIKERARELSVLNRVIVAAGEAEDLSTLLKNILDSTLELLDFDGGGIYLVDETEGEAELCCSKGLNQEFL
ncbi:MAG: hypothetical protein U9N73_03045, partial [Candidatus Auribacterota bacterium]|nr:hypothetical protein [Candidatus Auribacterota bacterium]